MNDIPQKLCTSCNQVFPATHEFFYSNKRMKDGLFVHCKTCKKAYQKDHGKKHRKEIYARRQPWRDAHREETREYKQQYYQSHKEEITEKNNAYREAHKEQYAEYQKQYQEAHREQRLDYHRQYYDVNKDQQLTQMKQHYEAYGDRIRERVRRYNKTVPGRIVARAAFHKRRAQKRASQGSYTAQQLRDQMSRQKSKCYYCKVKLSKEWHADHVVPLSRGGTNDISNIVIACPACNLSKHARLPHEWPEGGRLL